MAVLQMSYSPDHVGILNYRYLDLTSRPMLLALQDEITPPSCSCFGSLTHQNKQVSGSSLSGLRTINPNGTWDSDVDFMFE